MADIEEKIKVLENKKRSIEENSINAEKNIQFNLPI